MNHQNNERRDPLTGLLSRWTLMDQLFASAQNASDSKHELSLLLVDIDHFKSINDAFGHVRGDDVLREIAQRLQNALRGSDRLFRYGGDEFVFILPGINKKEAGLIAERLLKEISQTPVNTTPPLHLTLSIGLATYPEDTFQPEMLFELADIRLQAAKRAGRNQVQSIDPADVHTVLFDSISRLIERDNEVDQIFKFLDRLEKNEPQVLEVIGPSGSGRSRYLSEVSKSGRLKGFMVLNIEQDWGHPSSNILIDAFRQIDFTPNPDDSVETTIQKLLDHAKDELKTGLLIIIDDAMKTSEEAAEFLGELFAREYDVPVGAALSGKSSIGWPWHFSRAIRQKITLNAITPKGYHILLRILLKWEPPENFVSWIHRETDGLPGRLESGLNYLIKRGILTRENHHENWTIPVDIESIDLKDRLMEHGPTAPNNLPINLTVFIGRIDELKQIKRAIRTHHLITLVGPGGAGKTRLGIQAGYQLLHRFIDGVFFVPLEAVPSPELIVSETAEAISFAFHGSEPPIEQLVHYLADKNLLLIYDNFEHLTPHSEVVLKILKNAPKLKILVTTRERLNVMGEALYRVKGMKYPKTGHVEPALEYGAVKLFLHSARRMNPSFELTSANLPEAVTICRLLEGMPLGIELAAGWIHLLNCKEIAEEIRKSYDFLQSQERNLPVRHRSIRAVFEHSWELLDDEEKNQYIRLSIFRGGFTRTSASAIADLSIQYLSTLINKSLVVKSDNGRYTILEVLRQYSEEKLKENQSEYETIRENHSRYFSDWLQSLESRIFGPDDMEILGDIGEEIDNIRSGFEWSIDRSHWQVSNKYIEALFQYFRVNNLYHDGLNLFRDNAKKIPNSTCSDEMMEYVKNRLLARVGSFHFYLADYEIAEDYFQRTLDVFCRLNQIKECGFSMNGIGVVATRKCDYEDARKFHEKALEYRRKAGDRHGEAGSLNNLANVIGTLGDNEKARQLYQKSIDILNEYNDIRGSAGILANMGIISGQIGDHESERKLLQKSLDLRRELGDRAGIAISLDNLGNVERFLGNYDRALDLHEKSLMIRQEVGDRWGIALSFLNKGNILNVMKKQTLAMACFEEAKKIYNETGNKGGYALVLNNMAWTMGSREEIDAARKLVKESLEIFEELGDQWGIALCKLNLGSYEMKSEKISSAHDLYLSALNIATNIHYTPMILEATFGFALLTKKMQDFQKTAYLLGTIRYHPALSKETRDNVEFVIGELKSKSDPDTIELELEKGSHMNLMDQVKEILQEN